MKGNAFIVPLATASLPVVLGVAASCIPDLPTDALSQQDAAGSSGADASVGPSTDASADSLDASSIDSPPGDGGNETSPPPSGCGDSYIDLSLGEECDPPDPGRNYCTSDCKVNCPGGLKWNRNNHCYQLLSMMTASTFPAGPASATDLCSTITGGHVVTFASEEEYQAVLGYYLDAGTDGTPFWVGLEVTQSQTDNGHYTSAADYEPGWRPDCPGCYAHTPDPTVPLQGGNGFCVEAAPAAHPTAWQSVRCYGGAPLRVLCEREPSTTPGSSQAMECDAGICINLVWTYPQKTYVYMDIGLPAEDAEQSCRSLGGRLVVLGSSDEREQLWYQLSKQPVAGPPVQVWIGLARSYVDAGPDAAIEGGGGSTGVRAGPWVWDDDAGVDSYPPQWGGQQPVAAGPGVSTRAYLQYEPTFSSSTLAVDLPLDLTIGPPAYVCELRGPDAGM